MAQFRFGIIAPLVCRHLESREEKRVLREEVLSKHYRHPNGCIITVSERTVRYWLRRYKDHGLTGLFDNYKRARKNKGECRSISASILCEAELLRREEPSRTVRQIIRMIKLKLASEQAGEVRISERTLSRYLRAKGLTRRKLERGDGYFQRRECLLANELWQGDTSSGIWLPDPSNPDKMRRTKLIAFIDDATRVIVHAEFYFDEKLPSVVDAFTKALLKRGKPRRLLLDNGSNYRSHLIEGMCAYLGVELSFCKPRRPQGKGKIERWFRTAKESFFVEAQKSGIVTLTDLNARLQAWIEQEYHCKAHSELNCTPLQSWSIHERDVETLVPDEIRRALMIRERRKVHENTCCVVLDNDEYQVSPAYAGEMVELRWHPDLADQVEVWHQGVFVEVAERVSRPEHVSRKKESEDEPDHEPLSSSKEFLQALVEKNFGDMLPIRTRDDVLSADEFVDLVCCGLGRDLKEREIDDLRIFQKAFAPLHRDLVTKAIRKAVDVKGGGLHVRYLVQFLQQKVQEGRR